MDPFLLLFLDFDGVLNSVKWLKSRPSREQFASEMNISPEIFDHDRYIWGLRSIDPEAVAVLNRVVTQTQARVVVSSSWRTMYPLNRLQWMLRYQGFDHHLIGATPDGWEMRAQGGYAERAHRGQEITEWMKQLPKGLPVKWIVLDDELVPGHEDRLIQTDVEVGLTAELIPRIIETLFSPVKEPHG